MYTFHGNNIIIHVHIIIIQVDMNGKDTTVLVHFEDYMCIHVYTCTYTLYVYTCR